MTASLSHPVLTEADALTFEPSSPVYQVLEMLVSPKLAAAWLEARAPNRTIRQADVDKWARDMKRGHWARNGETIKFDRFGRLLDGQHRLWGIVLADVAVELTVVLGLEPEVMATVDVGRARTFGDVLSIAGNINSRHVAATARMIWNYEQSAWTNTRRAPSHTDLAAIMSRFPDLCEFINERQSTKAVLKLGQNASLAFVCYMAHRLDPVAEHFIYYPRFNWRGPEGRHAELSLAGEADRVAHDAVRARIPCASAACGGHLHESMERAHRRQAGAAAPLHRERVTATLRPTCAGAQESRARAEAD